MELILSAIIAFVSTNIDDIFLLTLFFSNNKFKEREIFIGQFLGIGCLIAISFIGSYIGLIIDVAIIGLLGLMPIYLGIRMIAQLLNHKVDSDDNASLPQQNKFEHQNILAIAAITIANGGDNIGIYIPLFATLTFYGKISTIIIFFIMTGVWCLIAKYFSKHPTIEKAVEKYGHIVTPFVLILLGIYILYKSSSVYLLARFF